MSANIISFPHPVAPIKLIAYYSLLGESGYKKLADLHVAGQLPATRVVVDASRYRHHKDLIASFKSHGAEIVLDTKAAELVAKGKFGGYAKHAPWAKRNENLLLGHEYFQANPPRDIVSLIAQFAAEKQVDTILAPSHSINDPKKISEHVGKTENLYEQRASSGSKAHSVEQRHSSEKIQYKADRP